MSVCYWHVNGLLSDEQDQMLGQLTCGVRGGLDWQPFLKECELCKVARIQGQNSHRDGTTKPTVHEPARSH